MIAIKLTHCRYAVIYDILSFGAKYFNESVQTSFWLKMLKTFRTFGHSFAALSGAKR